MSLEAKVTKIYCMEDDFCKGFPKYRKKYMVEERSHKQSGQAEPNERYGHECLLSYRVNYGRIAFPMRKGGLFDRKGGLIFV